MKRCKNKFITDKIYVHAAMGTNGGAQTQLRCVKNNAERENNMYGVTGSRYMNFTGSTAGRTNLNTNRAVYQAQYSWSEAVQNAAGTGSAGKTEVSGGKKSANNTNKAESAVEAYKRKHPNDASHVDSQVKAGKRVLEKNGAEDVSRDDMTMDEYKIFIEGLLVSIPFDSSRSGDREMVSISEAGWQQMKSDPDYEAWVLGYTSENRAVRNPFAAWTGGIFAVERFGASIESHHGESVSMNKSSEKKEKDEKSWWEKRHERYEELLERQVKASIAKRRAIRAQAQENLLRQSYGNDWKTQALASALYEENIMTLPVTEPLSQNI